MRITKFNQQPPKQEGIVNFNLLLAGFNMRYISYSVWFDSYCFNSESLETDYSYLMIEKKQGSM